MKALFKLAAIASLAPVLQAAPLQDAPSPVPLQAVPLTARGQVSLAGRSAPYVIHHLPVSSFPDLPPELAEILNQRGCTIPQTYEAHRPENVVHGSFERAGSSDWAVLCSAQGTVSLLVFLGSDASMGAQPELLASATETDRLQSHGPSGVLGFSWGIDAATPGQLHDAQLGLVPRPATLDHDALADSVIDHQTTYHFYLKGAWSVLQMPN